MRSLSLVACVLWWRAVGAQLSLAFSAVALAGRTQCPAFTRYATSHLNCPNLCYQLLRGCCAAFNFKQATSVCELFSKLSNNYEEVPGCSLYQVGFQLGYILQQFCLGLLLFVIKAF